MTPILHQPKTSHLFTLLLVPLAMLDLWNVFWSLLLLPTLLGICNVLMNWIYTPFSIVKKQTRLLSEAIFYRAKFEISTVQSTDILAFVAIWKATSFVGTINLATELAVNYIRGAVSYIPSICLAAREKIYISFLGLRACKTGCTLVWQRVIATSISVICQRSKVGACNLRLFIKEAYRKVARGASQVRSGIMKCDISWTSSILLSERSLTVLLNCLKALALISLICLVAYFPILFSNTFTKVTAVNHILIERIGNARAIAGEAIKQRNAVLQPFGWSIAQSWRTLSRTYTATGQYFLALSIIQKVLLLHDSITSLMVSNARFLYDQSLSRKNSTFVKAFTFGAAYNLCIMTAYVLFTGLAQNWEIVSDCV